MKAFNLFIKNLIHRNNLRFLLIGIAMAVVLALVGLSVPNVYSFSNLQQVIVQTSYLALLAYGATLIMICGGIDLSLPALMALAGCCCAYVMREFFGGGGHIVGILVCFAVAFLGSFVNGISVSRFMMVPMIATLAMQLVANGFVNLITLSRAIEVSSSFANIGNIALGPIRISVIYLLVFTVGYHLLLSKTAFGRKLYAVGLNPSVAENCGISVQKIRMDAYLLSAPCIAFATIIALGRLKAASTTMAPDSMPLDVLMSAVLGGTSMSGGKGTIPGTLLGAFLLSLLNNVLTLQGVNFYMTLVIKGLFILAITITSMLLSGERRRAK